MGDYDPHQRFYENRNQAVMRELQASETKNPRWDANEGQLYFRGVAAFEKPITGKAESVRAVLSAFERGGWPKATVIGEFDDLAESDAQYSEMLKNARKRITARLRAEFQELFSLSVKGRQIAWRDLTL